MSIINNGFYIISDKYFVDFPDRYLKGNKQENRPHYLCFKDKTTGLLWVIPISHQIEKYEQIINTKLSKGQRCDILHIIEIANRKECFLIQDMFPVTEDYILREFTIGNIHLILKDNKHISEINKKASKVMALIRKGIKFTPTQPDVLAIEHRLILSRIK